MLPQKHNQSSSLIHLPPLHLKPLPRYNRCIRFRRPLNMYVRQLKLQPQLRRRVGYPGESVLRVLVVMVLAVPHG